MFLIFIFCFSFQDLLSEASGETDMTDPSVTSDTRSMGSVEAAAVPSYEAPLDLKKGLYQLKEGLVIIGYSQ